MYIHLISFSSNFDERTVYFCRLNKFNVRTFYFTEVNNFNVRTFYFIEPNNFNVRTFYFLISIILMYVHFISLSLVV